MMPFTARLTFHGDLPFFLKTKRNIVERRLNERTSVKDIIEACGIPHTEVDLLLINGSPVDFSAVLAQDVVIEVYSPTQRRSTFFPENHLQVRDLRKFVADGHLGKLVRDLRLLGIDVIYDRAAEDHELIKIAGSQDRALLTRDRRLLMHSAVRNGYYLRSQNPLQQTVEILGRFNLASVLTPFTRCLLCNALLEPAEKEKIIGQLEPLTKVYYDQFRRCLGCGQVYWSGSHFEKLQRRIELIRSRVAIESVR